MKVVKRKKDAEPCVQFLIGISNADENELEGQAGKVKTFKLVGVALIISGVALVTAGALLLHCGSVSKPRRRSLSANCD